MKQTPRASVLHSLNACSTNNRADARGLTAVPAPSVSEGTDSITKCPNSRGRLLTRRRLSTGLLSRWGHPHWPVKKPAAGYHPAPHLLEVSDCARGYGVHNNESRSCVLNEAYVF